MKPNTAHNFSTFSPHHSVLIVNYLCANNMNTALHCQQTRHMANRNFSLLAVQVKQAKLKNKCEKLNTHENFSNDDRR